MRFSQDCLAATLYVVTSLLIAQSDNMGDKFMGAAAVIGPTWAGAIVAGVVVRFSCPEGQGRLPTHSRRCLCPHAAQSAARVIPGPSQLPSLKVLIIKASGCLVVAFENPTGTLFRSAQHVCVAGHPYEPLLASSGIESSTAIPWLSAPAL